MKSEDLMNPRFEVISSYPNCPFKVGDVLHRIKNATNDWFHANECSPVADIHLEDIEKHPHIFRKLNWWEHRTAGQMPKKLICKAIKGDNEVAEIEEWDMEALFGWIDKKKRTGCGLLTFNPEYGYFPVD